MSKIEEIAAAVEKGESKIIESLVQEALAEDVDPVEILNVGMIEAMNVARVATM